jgi:hypothetical protein
LALCVCSKFATISPVFGLTLLENKLLLANDNHSD